MKLNVKRLTEMSATELMTFVKECCKKNKAVTQEITVYSGCTLQWVKEVNGFVIFTVFAGMLDEKCVRNANEYITVSFEAKTEMVFCLAHYLANYGGYKIFVSSEYNCIKQEIGYAFGDWKYTDLNLNLTEKTSHTKQDFGCCCG